MQSSLSARQTARPCCRQHCLASPLPRNAAARFIQPPCCHIRAPAAQRRLHARSSTQETAGVVTVAPQETPAAEGLEELNKDTFYAYLETAGSSVVVVDFFTDWCGPCKVIYPELVRLSKKMPDVKFAKLNCNRANKELGKALGIKVAPTFHVYRNKEKVAEMTGAKVEKLVALIEEAKQAAPKA
ncbi:thioredoxin-like protein [Haematococcus lacustris]